MKYITFSWRIIPNEVYVVYLDDIFIKLIILDLDWLVIDLYEAIGLSANNIYLGEPNYFEMGEH